MEIVIKDGSTGNAVKVDSKNRAHAFSVSQLVTEAVAYNGDSYNFNTGLVSLTTGAESAVAYIKNNTQKTFIIPTIGYLLGNSTGGGALENLITRVYKNPTGGTIITNAVAADVFQNKNAGASKTFNSTDLPRYKGVEGDTLTGGTLWFPSLLPSAARQYLITTGDIVLPPAQSLGITIQPQASNTLMDLYLFMSINDLSNVVVNSD